MTASKHATTIDTNGRVHCECGTVSQRMSITNAKAWAIHHRRSAKPTRDEQLIITESMADCLDRIQRWAAAYRTLMPHLDSTIHTAGIDQFAKDDVHPFLNVHDVEWLLGLAKGLTDEWAGRDA